MQDLDLSQQIENLIEVTNMEMEQEPQNEDVDLMLRAPQVTIFSPPPPTVELAPGEEGEVVPLDNDMVMDTYNVSYGELQNKIVQAYKKHFLDDLTSPNLMRERVIMAITRKDPEAISSTKFAFTGEENSNN